MNSCVYIALESWTKNPLWLSQCLNPGFLPLLERFSEPEIDSSGSLLIAKGWCLFASRNLCVVVAKVSLIEAKTVKESWE